MLIIGVIIGFVLGLGSFLGLHEYHQYQKNQENMVAHAEELYIKMKALEIAKNKTYEKFTTDDEKNKLKN